MQTINRTGMILNVNNSWSGDTVMGRGVARALQLDDNDDTPPDIIAVYLGINDFRTGCTVSSFSEKYAEMIVGMKAKYPNADIYLFTLVYTDDVFLGVAPDDVIGFNAVIEDVAAKNDCALVDLFNDSGITKESLDVNMCDGALHPNSAGMELISKCFINVLTDKYDNE